MATGFNFQPIIQQHVPAPIQELGALGNVLQERYDTNLARWDELDLLANSIQVSQGDTYLRDNAIKDMRNQLAEIEESGAWERARPMVREAVKRLRGDQALSKAAQNYQAIQKFQNDVATLRAQGGTPLIFSQDPSQFRTVGEDGQLNSFQGIYEKQLEYREAAEKIFDDLKASSIASQTQGVRMGADGMIYNVSQGSSTEAITPDQIAAVASGNLAGFLQSNEGAQMDRVNQQLRGMSAQESQQSIKDYLVNVGQERIYGKTASSSGTSYAGQRRTQQDEAGEGYFGAARRLLKTQVTYLDDDIKGQQLNRTVKNAFDPEIPPAQRAANEASLTSRLNELTRSDNPIVKSGAREQLDFINEIKRKFPETYNEILYTLENQSSIGAKGLKHFLDPKYGEFDNRSTREGTSEGLGLRIGFQGRNEEGKEIIDKYFKMRDKYRTSNRNFIFDRPLENAYQDLEKTTEINWYRLDENFLKSTDSSTFGKGAEQLDISQYNLVKSEDGEKDLSNFKGTPKAAEVGVGIPGIGTAFQLIDADGKKYIVQPKEDSFIGSTAAAWNTPQIQFMHDIALGGEELKLVVDQVKSAQGSPNAGTISQGAGQELLLASRFLVDALRGQIKDKESAEKFDRDIRELSTPTYGTSLNLDKLVDLVNKYSSGERY